MRKQPATDSPPTERMVKRPGEVDIVWIVKTDTAYDPPPS